MKLSFTKEIVSIFYNIRIKKKEKFYSNFVYFSHKSHVFYKYILNATTSEPAIYISETVGRKG